ncbi:hypothetical protein [Flavilitoribacter nigricans]|nr:hypothetical protein [Flavilitoribacter nigricans]
MKELLIPHVSFLTPDYPHEGNEVPEIAKRFMQKSVQARTRELSVTA